MPCVVCCALLCCAMPCSALCSCAAPSLLLSPNNRFKGHRTDTTLAAAVAAPAGNIHISAHTRKAGVNLYRLNVRKPFFTASDCLSLPFYTAFLCPFTLLFSVLLRCLSLSFLFTAFLCLLHCLPLSFYTAFLTVLHTAFPWFDDALSCRCPFTLPFTILHTTFLDLPPPSTDFPLPATDPPTAFQHTAVCTGRAHDPSPLLRAAGRGGGDERALHPITDRTPVAVSPSQSTQKMRSVLTSNAECPHFKYGVSSLQMRSVLTSNVECPHFK